ncbi:MAG: amidohydrolase family protein [Clostridia bacterium]|nr:amidohydrolase family protein [Clostridia bacterium]
MKYYYNCRVYSPEDLGQKVIAVDDGKIVSLSDRFEPSGGDECVDCGGATAVPGFVDLHIHGAGGFGVSDSVDEIVALADFLAGRGTVAFMPTVLTAPLPLMLRTLGAIDEARKLRPGILGAYLEGPFLSKKMLGAQSPEDAKEIDGASVSELLSRPGLKRMTVAPELPGAFDLARRLSDAGVTVSAGHTAADFDTALAAFDNGFSDFTHIFNACTSHRKEKISAGRPVSGNAAGTAGAEYEVRVAGAAEAALVSDNASVQFIADGNHIPAGLIKLILKCKGTDGAYAITDALEFAGLELANGQTFTQKNGVEAFFDGGAMRVSGKCCLAGSCATMADCFRFLAEGVGLPIPDCAKLTSTTPARLAGVKTKGMIAPGYDADFVLM